MSWADVQGQPLPLQLLQAHLRQGRLAPAYLFAGPEGVGKRLTALELAKALNCEQPDPSTKAQGRPEQGEAASRDEGPCDRCPPCQRIIRRIHPDVHLLEPKGALDLIHLEEAHQALERIALRPFMGRTQVVIIDGADRLTEEAANGLLKSLEEPPAHARFLLLTSQPGNCLPTIVSRCQLIRFQRLPSPVIAQLLLCRQACDAPTAEAVSRLAQGSGERAVELAGQWRAWQEITAHLASDHPRKWLVWTPPGDRRELAQWLACSIARLRDAAVSAPADSDRCVDAALELVEYAASLQEQLVSARLVGTLLRETWIALDG